MEDPETPTPSSTTTTTVDTSRPFRSVKEAVAVFGERLLVGAGAGEDYSSSPKPPLPELGTWESRRVKEEREHEVVVDTLKKLEAELEETKEELRLLKEREEDTEVALASLNAELHKNMSKLAEAEAEAAAAATRRITMHMGSERKEEMKMMVRVEEVESPTLAQILSFGEQTKTKTKRGYFGGKNGKKKPIIPLVGDLLFRRKGSPHQHHALHSSFNSFNYES